MLNRCCACVSSLDSLLHSRVLLLLLALLLFGVRPPSLLLLLTAYIHTCICPKTDPRLSFSHAQIMLTDAGGSKRQRKVRSFCSVHFIGCTSLGGGGGGGSIIVEEAQLLYCIAALDLVSRLFDADLLVDSTRRVCMHAYLHTCSFVRSFV